MHASLQVLRFCCSGVSNCGMRGARVKSNVEARGQVQRTVSRCASGGSQAEAKGWRSLGSWTAIVWLLAHAAAGPALCNVLLGALTSIRLRQRRSNDVNAPRRCGSRAAPLRGPFAPARATILGPSLTTPALQPLRCPEQRFCCIFGACWACQARTGRPWILHMRSIKLDSPRCWTARQMVI